VKNVANPEQLERLLRSREDWNTWGQEHPTRNIDLSGADLSEATLSGADLRKADLSEATLSGATLWGATLSGANLKGATLNGTDLNGANLTTTDMTNARVAGTHFADLDLHTVKGLETLVHLWPSHISITTLYRSAGQIPDSFLRKAGIPEDFLLYLPSLINKAIEYYTCFISYSSKDQEFVERLYADLQSKGVRCWFAPEDLKTGDKIRDRIDQSIRLHDKLLLVLSEHSVNSSWVEFEVEAAIAKESSKQTLMLFPIRLDSAVKDSPSSWAAHIRRTRHITDFSKWKQHDAYQKVLNRLLRDLQPETPPITE